MAIKAPGQKPSGHGGKREGAGRKPAARAPKVEMPVEAQDSGLSVAELARRHVVLALETLAVISGGGASEAARVSAAKVILDHAADKAEQPGKKEVRARKAQEIATGRLSTPPPPKLVVNNGS